MSITPGGVGTRDCCGTHRYARHADDCKWTSIQISGPLPMGVAGALMQLIGTAWPEAMVETDTAHALSMLIPKGQAPKPVEEEFIELLRKDADADHEPVDFLGFREGWVAFAPPEEMCLALGEIAHAIMVRSEFDIVNHLEWTVLTGKEPDDPRYVLSISRSKGRTPLAMRKAAEAEVERLTALLEKHGIDPQEH